MRLLNSPLLPPGTEMISVTIHNILLEFTLLRIDRASYVVDNFTLLHHVAYIA